MKQSEKRPRIWNVARSRKGRKGVEAAEVVGIVDRKLEGRKAAEYELERKKVVVDDVPKIGVPEVAKNVVQDEAAKSSVEDAAVDADEFGEREPTVFCRGGGVLEVESVPKLSPEASEVLTVVPAEGELRDSHGRGGRNRARLLTGKMSVDGLTQTVSISPRMMDTDVRRDRENSKSMEGYGSDGPKQFRVNRVTEDVKVDVLDSTDSEEVQPDSRDDDATECSSSFGCTQSKEGSEPDGGGLQQNAEVQSELRDGNGAMSSLCAEDDEMAGGNERGKRALNADWKKYRRGIEWRCRWLEIRLNELQSRYKKYERELEESRASRKARLAAALQSGEESSARTAQMVGSPPQVMRRMRRKQVEDTVDLDVYMARHPLFSRYDKKRKGDMEDMYVEPKLDTGQEAEDQPNSVEPEKMVREESDTEEQLILGQSSVGGQDSMEQVLWAVEALQARVEKSKSQLSRGAPIRIFTQPLAVSKPLSNLSRGATQPSPRVSGLGSVPRPAGTKGRPPAGQSPGFSGTPSANGAPQRQGSALLRRKSSDYDINNMVMPVSAGAKFVEPIKHADIWTPHWRLIGGPEAAEQSLGGSSSEEDTDDERFENRHFEMEVNEKKLRYIHPSKRSPDGDLTVAAQGRSMTGMGKGAGKMSGRGNLPVKVMAPLSAEYPDSSSLPAFPGSIPKGKRRKRLFNATAFTTNHALRLAAYLAEPASPSLSHEVVGESMLVEDIVEKPGEEKGSEGVPIPEVGMSEGQPVNLADQAELKRKRSAASGLQVLANP